MQTRPASAFPPEQYYLDSKEQKHYTNDKLWVFDSLTCLWNENTPPLQNQTAVNAETRKDSSSMLHMVAITTKAVVNTSTNQIVQPEKIVAGPEAVMASDSNAALVAFGAKYKADLDKVDQGLWVVSIRAGI